MSISTYAELKTAVAAWLDRTDLDAYMPDFISMGENYLNYGGGRGEPLRVRSMQAAVNLSPTSNVYTLPSDFLSALSVTALTSPRCELDFISASGANRIYTDRSASTPMNYQIIGEEITVLPYTSSDIELVYFQQIPALTDLTPTNWLLEKHNDLYLRATQMMAADFIKDYQQAATMKQIVDQYISQLNDAELFDGLRNSSLTLSGVVV